MEPGPSSAIVRIRPLLKNIKLDIHQLPVMVLNSMPLQTISERD